MLHDATAISSVGTGDFGKERSRTAMLGKLVNISNEVAAHSHAADDFLKSVVAGDPVMVRFLYHEPFSVRLPTRIIVTCNEMFRVRDTSGAVEARMLMLTCNNFVPEEERDPQLAEKLRSELPGLFNRMVKAEQRLRDRGRFDPPSSHMEQLNSFTLEKDHVREWLLERTNEGKRVSDPEVNCPNTTNENAVLYLDFAEWSKLNGYKQISKIVWAKRLNQIRLPAVDLKERVIKVGGHSVKVRQLSLFNATSF
jgi:phage/plasmid-associated DNA primase